MRIPNQLNNDNLYRSRRSSPKQGGRRGTLIATWRQLIRLTIVLALVAVVMRQSLKTELYQVFFPAPPVAVGPDKSSVIASGESTVFESPNNAATTAIESASNELSLASDMVMLPEASDDELLSWLAILLELPSAAGTLPDSISPWTVRCQNDCRWSKRLKSD